MFKITYSLQFPDIASRLAQKKINIKSLLKKEVAVGFFSGEKTKKAPNKEAGQSISSIAKKNEFGVPIKNIPSRPFMQVTMNRYYRYMKVYMVALARLTVKGELTSRETFEKIGNLYHIAIKQSIMDNIPPPNSPITIAMKRSSRTLIDTGQMLLSVKYKIRRIK